MQIYQKILKATTSLTGAAVPGSQRGITDCAPPTGILLVGHVQ